MTEKEQWLEWETDWSQCIGSVQEVSNEQEKKLECIISMPAPSNLFPPVRTPSLKIPQAPPFPQQHHYLGPSVQTHEAMEDFSHSDHNTTQGNL